MLKVRPSMLVLAALSMLTSGPAAAEKDFETRWKEAEGNVKTGPGQRYFNDVFFKDSFAKLVAHINECAQKTGETLAADLRAAVELGASGKVLTVLIQAQSKSRECFAERVKKDTFPSRQRTTSGYPWR